MTHGEEPGPETHKDSAVLTYLEGLLMHPVVAGPGATASGRSEAAHSNQEQSDKVGGSFQLPNHGPTAPRAGTNGPTLGSSQHLKKARLLRSGAWSDPGSQRMSSPPMELNGQAVGGLQNGALEGSPHAGESTLLASLLQSFSSRLQSVAMSQHSNKPPSECSSPSRAPPADKEPAPVYGTASSRLKGLMRKNKLQNHSNTPYSRRSHSQDRPPESPRSVHSATPPAAPAGADSVSCAERLKAVANMVKIRSSPAPSPKPSVACSQLALLLSSEAHLQQYSREHALKAQLSGRSASERLAAMANQQHGPDKKPPGNPPGAPDALGSLTTQNGMTAAATAATALPRSALSSPQSPSLLRGHSQSSPPTPPRPPSHAHGHPPREKRGFDSRPTRPPQTCSSLLLLLLNNHNSQKQLTKNGHLEDGCGPLPPSGSSSVTSDSECSTQERSLTKDSSDAESCYSGCSPIDLSVRGRVLSVHVAAPKTSTPSSACAPGFPSTPGPFSPHAPAQHLSSTFSPSSTAVSTAISSSSSSSSFSTSSLDRLTESLINKWKPEPVVSKESKNKEPDMSPELKSHPKLTLMQLLLERRNSELVNKSACGQDLPLDITMATMSRNQQNGPVPWEEARTKSPLDRPAAPAQPQYPQGRDPNGALSPFSYPSPTVQSSPLDLCKAKAFPAEKASEPAFSASKLLQNLAQCGTASSSPPAPAPAGKALGPEPDAGRPLALLERLNAPIHRTSTTPLSDGASGSGTPFSRKGASPPTTQIENLLERRTVLQLLLGTGSASGSGSGSGSAGPGGRKDRRAGEVAGGFYEQSPGASVACDSSNGAPAHDVKVKSELTEEAGPSSAVSEDWSGRKRLSYERDSPVRDAQRDFKTEPRPAEVIAKYGLLSQLLKQQTATYYTSAAMQTEPPARPIKEEQREYLSPGPKKRRFCSERTDGPGGVGSPDPHAPAGPAESDWPRAVKEEDVPARSPPPGEPLARERRGFNVLKQLLLSDNCLKKLSQQPRGGGPPSPSPLQANGRANGGGGGAPPGQPAQNHGFLHVPGWHPHGPLNPGPPGNLGPPATPPAADGPARSPWNRHQAAWPAAHRRETPALVKQEPESIVRWGGRGSERRRAGEEEAEEEEGEDEEDDSNPDSPRLSRSNPILYYMLQKGSLQLRRDPAEGPPPAVRVKEEPLGDIEAYERRLSSAPQSPPHNDKHSRHGSQSGLSQSSE